MTIDLIKFAFVAGEVAPSYYGRADLEKFDLALAEAENWFVDYHGGLSNVQGTYFVDFIQNDEYPTKFFPFQFSTEVANKYAVLFSKDYIRFIQDGAYVLETAKTVTAATLGAQTKVTIASHGWSNGDWVQVLTTGETEELVNRTCQIEVISTTQVFLRDTLGHHIDSSTFTAYGSGMTIARIYTLTNPYAAEDIPDLRAHQIRDVLRLTHPDYEVYNLQRNDHNDWTIAKEVFTNTVTRPSISSSYKMATGEYAIGYVVTAVDVNGGESLPSDYHFVYDAAHLETVIASSVTLRFSEVTGAKYYNIYRTRLIFSSDTSSNRYNINRGFQVGYIGQSRGATFLDSGIVPDFTRTPPSNINPLARGAIRYIDTLSSDIVYARDATMTVSDATGSGFIGYPIVHLNVNATVGRIVGFWILDGGKNYTNPTISLPNNYGFTYDITLSETVGNDPSVGCVYQQRQIYAGTSVNPLTVYGSVPGFLSSFTESDILVASDSFSHEIDSQNFSPIRHVIPTRGGIIVMSAGGIWLMSGSQGGAITALDVQADLNVYTGVSAVEPLTIDTDILYTTAAGGRVNSLAYSDQYKLYSPTDVSILSNHLIARHPITRWAYADEPHRLVYAVREDGVMLLLTMVKDQEIYAWTRRVTKGQYLDVVTFEGEGDTDVYVTVRRKINGIYRKVIERLASRDFNTHEDPVFVDCGLALGKNYPEYDLEIEAASGTGVTVTATGPAFDASSVNSILRFGDGKARVVSVESSTSATIDIIRNITQLEHYSDVPRLALAGEWTLDAEVSSISGLHHLEGMTVTGLADGNVVNGTVTNGTFTLTQPASRVVLGIPYKSVARNLPLNVNGTVVENKRKRVTSLAMRLVDTRGVMVGTNLDELYSPRTELAEVLGESGPLYTGITHLSVEPLWSEEGQNYFVQEYPLPATILGYILDADIGDG